MPRGWDSAWERSSCGRRSSEPIQPNCRLHEASSKGCFWPNLAATRDPLLLVDAHLPAYELNTGWCGIGQGFVIEAAKACFSSAVAGSPPMRHPNIWPAYSNEIQMSSSTICGTVNSSSSRFT